MAGSLSLTWRGDIVLRIKTLGDHYIFAPGQQVSIPDGADNANASEIVMNLASLGLFSEIDPSVIPDTLGITPIATAIAATSPQPFNTQIPAYQPYIPQNV